MLVYSFTPGAQCSCCWLAIGRFSPKYQQVYEPWVFRGGLIPHQQGSCLVPRAGICLLKDETIFFPVDSAEFRTHEIPFDRIFKTVAILASKLQLSEKMVLQASWGGLRDSLESFPRRRSSLRKMNLTIGQNNFWMIPLPFSILRCPWRKHNFLWFVRM